MSQPFVLVTKTQALEMPAAIDGGDVRVPGLFDALGYELKPEGLCRDALCYPVPASMALQTDQGVSLKSFAALTASPVAIDLDESAAAVGEPAQVRASLLEDGLAPDFTLPDLSGKLHTLSDYRGRKVLLAAWASW